MINIVVYNYTNNNTILLGNLKKKILTTICKAINSKEYVL